MRLLKRIVEMIFIFVLPLLLVLTMFKTTKVYDSNNNEISRYIEFNNIFTFNQDSITYYNYEYYDFNEQIILSQNQSIYVNFNVNPFINIYNGYYYDILYYEYNDNFYGLVFNPSNHSFLGNNIESNLSVEYLDNYTLVTMTTDRTITMYNKFNNFVKNINEYHINDNIVNQGINLIFDYLGIETNFIAQLLVVYILLVLIMLLVWYIIYVPFDMLFGLLLRKLDYYK